MDSQIANRCIDAGGHRPATAYEPLAVCQRVTDTDVKPEASLTGHAVGGMPSHSSGAAALLFSPEGSSSNGGGHAMPSSTNEQAQPAAEDSADAACSQGSVTPEASDFDANRAIGQEGNSSGSRNDGGQDGATVDHQHFPEAGFSRKDTPYVCQVPGCGRDLLREKVYYRRYRVCRPHAAAKEVGKPGDKRRYCQQCSIFHFVHEFDDEKRTCRARLQWHNSKRRKQTEMTGVATANERPAAAQQRKSTRSCSSTLEAALQAAQAAGAHSATAEAAPAVQQLPRAAMAQRSVKRRSLGKGVAGNPVPKPNHATLPPFGTTPKGRRTTAASASAQPSARVLPAAAPLSELPAVLAPSSAPQLQLAEKPGCCQGSVPAELLPRALPDFRLLPNQLLGTFTTLFAAPQPPPLSAATQLQACSAGVAAPCAAAGPLPPPGHAWSAPHLPTQQAAAQQQQTVTPPPQQQLAAGPQLPEHQPPSAHSCCNAADWHAELLQMPLDWDGRLPEDAPGAAGLPAPPLQGGAALPPSPQGGRPAAGTEVAALLAPAEAHDLLEAALLPPPPPPDVEQQLEAAAAQFPAVAAAAAAAWGLQWPPPLAQQACGATNQLSSPEELRHLHQCTSPQPMLLSASACIERLGSNPTPLHDWGAVPICIEPALPDLAWSLAMPLQGGHVMKPEPLLPLLPGTTFANQKLHTGAAEGRLPAEDQQQPAAHCMPVQQHVQESASDSSTHCSQAMRLQTAVAAAAADDVWDGLLPDDIML